MLNIVLHPLLSSSLYSPLAYVDPCHCNMARLFVELLKDSLNEYAYAAEIAGIGYKVENTMYGIFVSKPTRNLHVSEL